MWLGYSCSCLISFIDNSVFLCSWIVQVWFIVGSKGTEKSGRHSWYQSLGLVITEARGVGLIRDGVSNTLE